MEGRIMPGGDISWIWLIQAEFRVSRNTYCISLLLERSFRRVLYYAIWCLMRGSQMEVIKWTGVYFISAIPMDVDKPLLSRVVSLMATYLVWKVQGIIFALKSPQRSALSGVLTKCYQNIRRNALSLSTLRSTDTRSKVVQKNAAGWLPQIFSRRKIKFGGSITLAKPHFDDRRGDCCSWFACDIVWNRLPGLLQLWLRMAGLESSGWCRKTVHMNLRWRTAELYPAICLPKWNNAPVVPEHEWLACFAAQAACCLSACPRPPGTWLI